MSLGGGSAPYFGDMIAITMFTAVEKGTFVVVVYGKVVMCDRGMNALVEKGVVIKDTGGVEMIFANIMASREEF